MTLEELDAALEKTGLDLKNNPLDMDARNQILALHGQSILSAKKERCSRCWHKMERNKCLHSCEYDGLPQDPVEASKAYLSRPNDISIFPFMCMYMVPIYEKTTGQKDTMKNLTSEFKRRWRQEHGDEEDEEKREEWHQ